MPPDTAVPDRTSETPPSEPARPHRSRMNSLWRMKPYLRPYAVRLILIGCRPSGRSGSASSSRSSPRRSSTAPSPGATPGRSSRSGSSPWLSASSRRCSSSCGAGSRPTPCSAWRPASATTSTRTCSGCRWLPRPLADRPAAVPGRPPTCRRSGGSSASACSSCSSTSCSSSRSSALLLHMYWPLGLLVAGSAVPVIWSSRERSRAQYLAISRRVQDQQGDLATVVEESAVGIRVIKAFGRRAARRRQLRRGRPQALRRPRWSKVRLSARFWTLPRRHPEPHPRARAAARRARRRLRGSITLGALVAFITLMLQLVWPIDVARLDPRRWPRRR